MQKTAAELEAELRATSTNTRLPREYCDLDEDEGICK
jgi:hypothetical protein